MANLSTVTLPDTNTYGIRAGYIPFGKVDNTSTSTAFTATVPGITALVDGACCYLMNGVVTSASGWTLNVNNLGALPVYQTLAASTVTSTIFNVNYTMLFVYNSQRVAGGCWDIFYGYNSNTTYSNASLGQGYATCSTAEATVAKAASLSSYALTTGGIVAVKFTYAVPANATLNVNSKGAKAIYYRGAKITAGIIEAGDIAYFIYSTYYHLLGVDSSARVKGASSVTDVGTGTSVVGTSTAYARGDHQHAISSGTITTALGYTPYDSSNPSGYITDAGVTSFNGSTGAVTYTAPVTSVNGNTGAVTVAVPSAGTTATAVRTSTSGGSASTYSKSDHVHSIDGTTIGNALGYTPADKSKVGVIDDTNDTPMDIVGIEQDTISGISGVTVHCDDGSLDGKDIFFPDGVGFNTGSQAIINQIPTKTSDLNNDSGFLTSAVTSFNGSTGAVTYTAPVTSVNGATGAVTISVPSNTSDLNNDSGFITNTVSDNFTVDGTSYILYLKSAAATNSPCLVFQRGTLSDNYNDWQIQDRSGYLYFDERGNGSTQWTNRVYFDTTGTVHCATLDGSLAWSKVTSKPTIPDGLSITGNTISLMSGATTVSSITLPVYNGGVNP